MSRFTDKVIVLTGAGSGIGAATARRLAAEGASLVLGDIDSSAGGAVAEELDAFFLATDVTNEGNVAQLLNCAVAEHGRIDVWINNAGIMGYGTLPDLDAETFRQVIDIDLNSVFYGYRAVIPHFQQSGGGIIVNTASNSGLAGDYATPSYNAAKAGVVNLTRSLAIEHADQNIRVNCVCPGPIDTPMTAVTKEIPGILDEYAKAIPMGRLGSADEVAATIAFLSSDDAAYVTGHALVVDGGLTACTGQPNFRRTLNLG